MSDKKIETKTTKKGDKPKSLVDDEEFEEFPVQEWAEKAEGEDEEVSVWEDNWDEETLDCPFSKQLKEELSRHGHSV